MPLRLFLVRHGESVDNVAGLLAGIRDSPLTSHGVLQARRLGTHLAARGIGPISHIFASNLQRAVKTAEAVAEAQAAVDGVESLPEVTELVELREKNFGSDEGVRFVKRDSPAQRQQAVASTSKGHVAPESQDVMQVRVQQFIAENLVQAISQAGACPEPSVSIIVVAHGIILNVLLRCLLTRWGPTEFAMLPGADDAPWGKEWLTSWSNTGYLEFDVRVTPTPVATVNSSAVELGDLGKLSGKAPPEHAAALARIASDAPSTLDTQVSSPEPSMAGGIQLSVKRVNCVEHLQGLKKTRGGIGSAGFDEKQKTMDSFLSRPAKRPKRDDTEK